ncbi:YcxB family protein [Paenibacillus athensensis]
MPQAIKTYFLNTLRYRLIIGIGLIALLLNSLVFLITYSKTALVVGLLLLFVIVVEGIRYYYVLPNKYRKNTLYSNLFSLTVTEQEIRFSSNESDSRVSWAYIKKVWETKDLYYLFLDKHQFWIVPKDQFASKEDHIQFREIVLTKHRQIYTGINRT